MSIFNEIQRQAHDMQEQTVGKVAVTIGSGGTLYQMVTDSLQLFALLGNALLIIGGLYLMYHKIMDRRRDRRQGDHQT
jgi:hypothetical protein